MPRQSRSGKATRRRHSEEFKSEALALAEKVGVGEAAAQLQLQPSQLYAWRSSAERTERRGKVEQEMAAENARLKRQLAEKEQEVAIATQGENVTPGWRTASPVATAPDH